MRFVHHEMIVHKSTSQTSMYFVTKGFVSVVVDGVVVAVIGENEFFGEQCLVQAGSKKRWPATLITATDVEVLRY